MDYSERVTGNFHKFGLDALVVIGGDGTLAIAHQLSKKGIPIVGVPKTIDNDIVGTVSCFGFDTAVNFATDAIDRLHTTADVMVASQPPDIVTVPLEAVVGKQKRVPLDFDLIRTARAVGITFGDETTSSPA